MSIHRLKSVRLAAVVFGLAVVLSAATPATAAVINGSATGIASPTNMIDFGTNLFSDNTAISTQFSGEGVTFSDESAGTPIYRVEGVLGGPFTNFAGAFLESRSPFPSIIVSFDSVVSDVSFNLAGVSNPNSQIQALLDGNPVETLSLTLVGPLGGSNPFYGFTDIAFDQITMRGDAFGTFYFFDNLHFAVSPVPLPAALPLLASALAGLGFFGWRRRKLDALT